MSETSTITDPVEAELPGDNPTWHNRDGRLRGSEAPIAGRCGAQLRGTSPPRYCAKWPLKGKTRCKRCGGASLVGVAHPKFTKGKYSQALPAFLKPNYDLALERQNLKQLADDIAYKEAEIISLMGRMESGQRGQLWDDLQAMVIDAQAGKPIDLEELAILACKGRETEHLRAEIDACIHSKARLIQIEGKRMADMGEVSSKDEVRLYFRIWASAVKEHVTDPKALQAIMLDIQHAVAALNPGAKPQQIA